jgi:integrase
VTGLHVVRKGKPGRLDRWYVYAWRGGPCIHMAEGARPVIGPDLLAKAAAARSDRGTARHADTLDAQIDAYRASPQFDQLHADGTTLPGILAAGTQQGYRLWLDRISQRFGRAPLAAFTDPRMRGQIIAWRDTWSHQPRTADMASGMMSTLLAWVVDHGRLPVNVAAGISHLHRADKSDEIWEARHARAFVTAPRALREALKVKSLTGLRLAGLVSLQWHHVGTSAVIIEGQKRGGRAVIPITPALRHLLARMAARFPKDEQPHGAILRNTRGDAWTYEGLKTAFQRARPAKFDRTMHDLRGTFATRLIVAGFTDAQAAMVLGWTATRIAQIRARYVNEERVIIELAAMMNARQAS